MVKSYEQLVAFGVVVSGEGNITYDSSGKHLLAPALENVGIWNARQGICTKTLVPSLDSLEAAVTSLACSPSSPQIASGYADGRIRFWDSDEGTCKGALNGHDQAVAVIRYNKLGFELASGGKDHDIILWDARTEAYRYHLRGHRDQVTDLVFLDSGKKLVSSSKDKLLRVWDLEGQFCMQRVGDHYSEIWSIDVDPEERFLVSGSADMELRFYTIKHDSVDILKSFGEIQRQSKDRVATVRFNKLANLLACQVAGKTVEVYSVLDEATAKHPAKHRLRRKKDRKSADGGEEGNAVTAADVFKLLHILQASNKICSIAFCPVRIPKRTLATLAVSLNNNILQSYSISSSDCSKVLIAKRQGHRSVVRSVTLSSDNTLLMSISHTTVSIWNPLSGSIRHTIDSAGYGLCGLIIPENDYALVGTEEGTIEIIHLQSSMFLEAVKAHGGFVRSMAAIPNENRFVTGGADHDVKVWEYHRKRKAGQNTKCLTVSNVKTMKMDSAVFVVAVSPDAKFIAVALLDYTVKVLVMDRLESFRTLDVATLPILCMDISSDGKLIVTGSADQKLRLWRVDDLGNCKIITAHCYSVMAVKFVPNSHCMFSVGKDGLVKYWDADKFKLLLTLEGHHAGVWCLAISKKGDFVITGSRDRSIRRWNLTKETLIIEEGKGDVGV